MSEGLKTIPIEQLCVGMFVEGIPEGSQYSVRAAGLVSSKQLLRAIQRSGIKQVVVDFNRSNIQRPKSAADGNQQPASEEANQPVADEPAFDFAQEPSTDIEQESRVARELFGQAKGFAKLAFDKAQHGETIELAEAEQLGEEMIRSVFRNSSALLCVTRLRSKDQYLLEHSIGVAILVAVFARHLKLPPKIIHEMTVGALMHDVGKIHTPDEVLHKPGRLTPEEFEIMKRHVVDGYRILKNVKGIAPLSLEMAANHHERPDGKGYPRGLKGKQLSRYARMIGICDCYDAMTADRVYRKGMEPTKALRIMLEGAPEQFDSELVAAFIRCIGVYPISTLVELESGKVAIVVDNGSTPVTPIVKVVYDARHKHHLPHQLLALDSGRDKIKCATLAEKYDLDLRRLV